MKTSIRTHEGHVALVTGASQGIGQAIALALAGRGAHVIATDLKPPHETAEKIGAAATPLQLDVTQEENWCSVSVKSLDVVDASGNSRISMEDYAIAAVDELEKPRHRSERFTIGY